jgi:Tfp pilus assembly protein PilP
VIKRTPRNEVTRSPVHEIKKEPVSDPDLQKYKEQLESMSIRELRSAIITSDFSIEHITALLTAEKAAEKTRVGAVKVLEKELNRLASSSE